MVETHTHRGKDHFKVKHFIKVLWNRLLQVALVMAVFSQYHLSSFIPQTFPKPLLKPSLYLVALSRDWHHAPMLGTQYNLIHAEFSLVEMQTL